MKTNHRISLIVKLSLFYLSVALIASRILFSSFDFLNPRNLGWLGIDNTTSYLAQLFYLSDKWQLPLLANPKYGGELTSSLTFTGPSPILLLVQKALRINPEFQLYGIWIILNLFLQLCFSFYILRVLGLPKKVSAIGALLFLSPFLLFRASMHFWLISHFLIVWSLTILLKALAKRKLGYLELTLLLVISYLINIYIMIMVIAILLVAFAVEASYNEIVNRVFSFKTLLKRFSHLVSVIFSAYILLDGLPHETSMYEGIKKYLSSTYGKHPFNLISMFNPDTGLVAEGFSIKDKTQILNFSITNVSLGMTKGSYEGFSYLGMGCIIIFLLSFVLSLKSIGTKTRVRLSREKLILVFGLALILMFAITYRVCIGSYEYSLPSNVYAQWVLGFLRSSGRFVWPIAYFLIAISLANLYKSKISLSMREKSRLMFLFLVVAFQAIDVTFPLIHRQIVFDFSPSTDFRRDFSSEYVYKTRDYKQIAAWPQGNFIENHYAELNYLAWKAGQVTDLIFTSRINMRAMYRLESKTYRQICSGEMDRNKLYAVSNEYLNRLDNCQGSKKILYKTSTHTYFIGS